MFPILLDLSQRPVLLVGEGEAALRRLKLLDAAGADVAVYTSSSSTGLIQRAGCRLRGVRPTSGAFKGIRLVFLAGLSEPETQALAEAAHGAGTFVNAEDNKTLCDFYLPSILRRGDLTLTVSTGGKAPGLAKRLRRHLEGLFGPEWPERVEQVARRREGWRAEGVGAPELGRRIDAYIEERGWFA